MVLIAFYVFSYVFIIQRKTGHTRSFGVLHKFYNNIKGDIGGTSVVGATTWPSELVSHNQNVFFFIL